MKGLLTALALAGCVIAAEAYPMAGAKLRIVCNSSAEKDEYICSNYIKGVADAYAVWMDAGGFLKLKKKPFCLEDDTSVDGLELSVAMYLRAHPEEIHHEAAVIIWNAFVEAFPCSES